MQTPGILRPKVMCVRIGVSRSTLYALVRSGKLKKPIKIGPRASGWTDHDAQDYIDRCERDSRGEKA